MRRVLRCWAVLPTRGVVPATPPEAFFGASTYCLARVVIPPTVQHVPDRDPECRVYSTVQVPVVRGRQSGVLFRHVADGKQFGSLGTGEPQTGGKPFCEWVRPPVSACSVFM